MKEIYETNKDFKDYVDNYMKNKSVTLEEVLGYKITQIVAEMYVKENMKE